MRSLKLLAPYPLNLFGDHAVCRNIPCLLSSLITLILFGLAGCTGGGATEYPHAKLLQKADLSAQHDNEDYLLQVGDTLDIKFFYNTELNENVTIRPDGYITLQLIDDIKASGLTPSQLDRILTEKYSSTLRNAEVAVIVRSFSAYRIYVGGEVKAPGTFALTANMTALQAILQAGGFNTTAELRNIVIMRNQGTQEPLFITLDLKGDIEALNHGDMPLKPYDILFVPKSGIAKLNQFVDQYITDLIPISLDFGFVYNLNPELEIKN